MIVLDTHKSAPTLLAFLKRLVLKHCLLPLMPSATYFFSTGKKVGKKCRSHAPRG